MTTVADISNQIETATQKHSLTAEIVVCVQDALEMVCDAFEWKQLEGVTTYALSASEASVALTTLVPGVVMRKIRHLRYEKSADGSIWFLHRKSLDAFSDKWGYSILTSSKGTPIDYMEDGGSVTFGPTPDAAATIRVYYKKVAPTAGDILIPARRAVTLKAYEIFWLEYGDLPDVASKYELWYQAELQRVIAAQPRGDEITSVGYRDL